VNNVKPRDEGTIRQHFNGVTFNDIKERVSRLHQYVDSHHVKPGTGITNRATTRAAEQVE